jgi:hypothetical protein
MASLGAGAAAWLAPICGRLKCPAGGCACGWAVCADCYELVRGAKGYVPVSRPVELVDVERLVDQGLWDCLIVSERLSPELVGQLPAVDQRTFAVNGAIILQIGRPARRGPSVPSLRLVSKVATDMGDVRTHDEYALIFEAAVRSYGCSGESGSE